MKLFNSLTMNYETRLMLMAEKVIAQHAAPMLEKLGLAEDNDGILDRMAVSREADEKTPQGMFYSQQLSKGFMGKHGLSYVKESGTITLYPLTMMNMSKDGVVKTIPMASLLSLLFSRNMEKHLIFILAHEMRHYWQYYTGIVFTEGDYIGSARFMPYSMRWEEKDANEWAAEYVKEIK